MPLFISDKILLLLPEKGQILYTSPYLSTNEDTHELENLSNQSKPFFFGMLTVDTHFPYGYVCDECKNELDSQMKNVVRCADNQVGKFLDWIQNQEWFSNTTVVILGDHAYLDAPLNNFITEHHPL